LLVGWWFSRQTSSTSQLLKAALKLIFLSGFCVFIVNDLLRCHR
jgi:hypothetical protein